MLYSKKLVEDYSLKRADYNETDQIFFREINAVGVAGKRVFDLGCGDGKHAIHIKQLGALHVIGVDINESMIKLAQTHAAGIHNIEFFVSNGKELPVADSSVDLVVSNFVIHYFENAQDIFNEIGRILVSGGYFIGTFNLMEAEAGFEYLYNQQIPIQLGKNDGSIVVYNLAKSRSEIMEAIAHAGLSLLKEETLQHPNAVISDSFSDKKHLSKEVVLMVLQKT